MNLGNLSDWGTLLALAVGVLTITLAVWKLARSAASLELSMSHLADEQRALSAQMREHLAVFRDYQKQQSEVILEIQTSVNKLTWEFANLKGRS